MNGDNHREAGMPERDGLPARRSVSVTIEGKVQGVGFRNWTQRMAGQLNLSGWVRNRRDGSVEAVLSGPVDRVEEALQRCRMGPRSSKVTNVAVVEDVEPVHEGFEIRPGI
jgi:acylphosphatase